MREDMIEKSLDHAPFMLSGCIVCDGLGRMMVTCTGPDSGILPSFPPYFYNFE